MVRTDDRNTSISTTDQVLAKAWEDRRNLHRQMLALGNEVNKLDAFISVYVERTGVTYTQEGVVP